MVRPPVRSLHQRGEAVGESKRGIVAAPHHRIGRRVEHGGELARGGFQRLRRFGRQPVAGVPRPVFPPLRRVEAEAERLGAREEGVVAREGDARDGRARHRDPQRAARRRAVAARSGSPASVSTTPYSASAASGAMSP